MEGKFGWRNFRDYPLFDLWANVRGIWRLGEEERSAFACGKADSLLSAQLAAEQRARELLREGLEMLGEEQDKR